VQDILPSAINIFFTRETLAVSCAKGNEKKGKNGHQPLDPLVIAIKCTRLGAHQMEPPSPI